LRSKIHRSDDLRGHVNAHSNHPFYPGQFAKVEAYIATLEQQSETSGAQWQPIETAPQKENIDIWVADTSHTTKPKHYRMTTAVWLGGELWMAGHITYLSR
jgi:hypothetical protein